MKEALWYRRAADLGNRDAMYNLGTMYQQGLGVPQDEQEARKWLAKASLKWPRRSRAFVPSRRRRQVLRPPEAADPHHDASSIDFAPTIIADVTASGTVASMESGAGFSTLS